MKSVIKNASCSLVLLLSVLSEDLIAQPVDCTPLIEELIRSSASLAEAHSQIEAIGQQLDAEQDTAIKQQLTNTRNAWRREYRYLEAAIVKIGGTLEETECEGPGN